MIDLFFQGGNMSLERTKGFFLLLGFVAFFGLEAQNSPLLFEKEKQKPQILIHNRVLAKVNQKPITVLDVMKKMDMVFYQQYPQYAGMPELRYQFYMVSWKQVLEELVDKEMIMADAEEMKMEVSGADVRQELEEVFGPNIISNLDKAGLTMTEAMKMVQEEITLKRMMYVRVHSKAFKDVTPQEIRLAYDRFIHEYEKKDKWFFHIITIRDTDSGKLDGIVKRTREKLREETVDIEDFSSWFKKIEGVNLFTSVKVSDLFEQLDSDLSPKYQEILSSLSPGEYSAPQKQVRDNAAFYKIYYLHEFAEDSPPEFYIVAPKLKEELMMKIAESETIEYKKRLRKQFPVAHMESLISSHFEPFTLEVDGKKINIPLPNS